MTADLHDMRAVADEMGRQDLTNFRGGTGKMRNIVDRGRGLAVHEIKGFVASSGVPAYKVAMNAANTLSSDPGEIWSERCFDLLRGAAVLTGNDLLLRLARTVSRFPEAQLHVAFNHRQIASKIWARDELARHGAQGQERIWIVGGWYGVLSALLFADDRLSIGRIESFDIDPAVAVVAESLNELQVADGRFAARTADMYALDYADAAAGPDLVVNTSCEHIDDLPGWLALLPRGMRVLLQSNDYFDESEHVNSQATLEDFSATAGLAHVAFAGSLYLRKYTRFMLIGRV